MTKEQAQENTEQLNKAEKLLSEAMMQLEFAGVECNFNLDMALSIITGLPEYEANE